MKTNSLYISSVEPNVGSILISLGFMQLLKKRYYKVAFFRPIIQNRKDSDIDLIHKEFDLTIDKKSLFGFTKDNFELMLSNGEKSKVIEILIDKFKYLQSVSDFVLVEGFNKKSLSLTIDYDINLELAQNFQTPIINILSAKNKSEEQILNELRIESDSIDNKSIYHFATYINRVDKKIFEKLKLQLLKRSYDFDTFLIPESKELAYLSVNELKKELKYRVIYPKNSSLTKSIKSIKIASMNLIEFLKYIEEGDLVVVSSDRADIIVGIFCAVFSKNSPNISSIILTGQKKVDKTILNLIKGFDDLNIPILASSKDTYKTVTQINSLTTKITNLDRGKIALALGLFEKFTNIEKIESRLDCASFDILTPLMFQYTLFQRAKLKKRNILLPESSDDRVLKATQILLNRDVVDITLLGSRDKIMHRASLLGLDLSKAKIINPLDKELIILSANTLYTLRKEKGLLKDEAFNLIERDYNYFSTILLYLGYVDGIVSGAISTTANTIRPALQIIKTKKNIDIVSSIFFMALEKRVLIYGDCAINQNPTANQLAQIAISSSKTAKEFNIDPKVALLSYSTGNSGTGEDVQKVKDALKLIKKLDPSLKVDGPIQYDAAIDKEVALKKLPNSTVAGDANLFIFPDLNTGNNTYKAVQRSSNALAIGPIVQGLNKPVNDLSRGCLVDDIVNTVVITAIQAQTIEKS